MISITDRTKCCGCAACADVCPHDCIEMREDEEGFMYPFVNAESCTDCGICNGVCPVLNHKDKEQFVQKAYIVQHKNSEVLAESTAGGAFTAIAEYVINKGGVVFGVELTDDLSVRHIYAENKSDLRRFRNSKYVQSFGAGIHKSVKSFLKQGRFVCFSGTPCQIEGMKNYLGKDYDNLVLVDVVCRAVPSPLIFRKYVEYQEDILNDKVKKVRFRDKHYGYKYSTMKVITDGNDGNYHQGVESDPWLRAFFSNICDRPSCHCCRFRNRYRISDFTIWDCFNVYRFSKELDNDRGATKMLVHTEKGQRIFSEICSDFFYVQAEPDKIISGSKEMVESPVQHERRSEFFNDAQKLSATELFEKYFPKTFRVKAEHAVRLTCYKLGIYSIIKRLYVHIMHKY